MRYYYVINHISTFIDADDLLQLIFKDVKDQRRQGKNTSLKI